MNKHRKIPVPLMGSIAVLLLTLLALLSLNRGWMKPEDPAEKAVAEYYAADIEAEKILAMLRNGVQVKGTEKKGNVWHYSCPISEGKSLFVEVDGRTWEILRWEAAADPGEN